MKLLFFIILGSLSIISCKPSAYTLENYEGRKLSVANGGGFSGQLIQYTLFENGQVFRFNSLNNLSEEKKKLDKQTTEQIFNNYTFLGLDKKELNVPGNMYFYIMMEDENGMQKLLWNSEISNKIDNNIKLFYRTVLNSVKD